MTTWHTYGSNKYVEHADTQIPLNLSWGQTVWKTQGDTFTKNYCIGLGKGEAEHGLKYVGLSKTKQISQIGIILAMMEL